MNSAKLFISHSSKDSFVYEPFVRFMTAVGIPEKQILCTSMPGTHIRSGELLYEKLRDMFNHENLLFVMLLSPNYYASTICLNEMGAAWVKQIDTQFFILPGLSFKEVEGVIREGEKLGISLADWDQMTIERLYDFKQSIEEKFQIAIEERLWTREQDRFLEQIKQNADTRTNHFEMQNAEAYCIGETKHDAWKIIKSGFSEIEASLQFSRTPAELCSLVFHPSSLDWSNYARKEKRLCFGIAARSGPVIVNVELDLYHGRRKRYPIVILPKKMDCGIPLSKFSNILTDWTEVNQICFVFHREEMTDPSETIWISIQDLRVED